MASRPHQRMTRTATNIGVAWRGQRVRPERSWAIRATPATRYGTSNVKQESLIDVEDVALGHRTALAWNPRVEWIFSDQQVHPALVSREIFHEVQLRLGSRARVRPDARYVPDTTTH
jgi:hypothetical protein